jgi:hypothetical protein
MPTIYTILYEPKYDGPEVYVFTSLRKCINKYWGIINRKIDFVNWEIDEQEMIAYPDYYEEEQEIFRMIKGDEIFEIEYFSGFEDQFTMQIQKHQ